MKASKNQNLSPTMRYKLAALKRFTNFMFWGPPLIIGAIILVVWQYQQHPEWLLQGGGQKLAPSNQFEEPGIYDDLPNEVQQPSFPTVNGQPQLPLPNTPIANPNRPSILNPNPELEASTFTNPLTPARKPSSKQSEPDSKLPNLFLPLFPESKSENPSNPPSPPISNSTPPIELNINSESELQKAMQRRSALQNQPSSSLNNSQYTAPNTAPNANSPVTPNQGISSYNPYSRPLNQPQSPTQSPNSTVYSPNYQSPYAPQPTVPQTAPSSGYRPTVPQTAPNSVYRPLPTNSFINSGGQPNQPSQPYSAPTVPNYGNNYRTSPNQVPTINGRPAPRIEPSLPN